MRETLAVGSLFLFVLAWWPIGLWQPGEATAVGLWTASSSAAMFLRLIPRGLWPVAAVGALTAIMMPLQPFPMRSWLGSEEVGIGGAWYAALGILAALMVGVRDQRQLGHCVLVAAGLAGASAFLLPIGRDWLAFVGLAVLAQGTRPALVLAAVLVLASSSKGALAVGLAVAMLWLFDLPRWVRAGAAVMLPAAVTAATFFAPYPSLESRALLWRAVGEALWRDPWLLLQGNGWGGYNDLLLTVLPALDAPDWEGRGGGAFHSHSAYVEALGALGMPGLLAMLAAVAVPAWYAEDRRALTAWVGLAGLSALWFPLPMCVPFMAYALCRCCARS